MPMRVGMSYASAISSISQILDLQQQIEDPASAAAASSTTSTDETSASTSASYSAFAAELEEALTGADEGDDSAGEDLSSLTSSSGDLLGSSDSLSALLSLLESAETGSSTGNASAATAASGTASGVASGTSSVTAISDASASAKVQAMVNEADSLIGKPYVWGGGHSGWGAQSGYDCSGFVSAVLHAGGYLSSPQDTETLPNAAGIESGAGQYVTIYDRTDAGSGEDHVIIDIGGQFYESGGEHSSWGGGGGVEKISTPSAAYLSTFNDILHPSGL